MPTKFNMTKDVAGYNGFGLAPCSDSYAAVLVTGVAQTITTPSEYPSYIAIFSYGSGANIWVDCVTTAVAPTGSVAATSACLNPAGIKVTKGTAISVINPETDNRYISVRFFVVPEFGN